MKAKIVSIHPVDNFYCLRDLYADVVGQVFNVSSSPMGGEWKEFSFAPDDRSLLPEDLKSMYLIAAKYEEVAE